MRLEQSLGAEPHANDILNKWYLKTIIKKVSFCEIYVKGLITGNCAFQRILLRDLCERKIDIR